MWVLIFGGLGLFLLGMTLLTDGLKAFAGDALRQALLRFTKRPVEAFFSGVAVTALVQSSSATTLATIGFVSAGLLPFSHAVGVLMGASLGTTSTGWLVSLFGLKFSIAKFALPVVGVGALLKLLGRGRWNSIGTSLAGFGLIFVGIDFLQQGMGGAAERFDVASLPATGFFAHAGMMGLGVLLTVVMQSSSAAVATALSALYAGAIGFEQAASLVIGAAVGTTTTAALASIGTGVPARRTALAHILFNLATGVIALILLPVFLGAFGWAQDRWGGMEGAIALAAFHTLFIGLGVVLFLPWVRGFASWIERVVPEREIPLTRFLDQSLLEIPPVALEASRKCLQAIALELVRIVKGEIPPHPASADTALIEVRDFLSRIPAQQFHSSELALRGNCLHAMDHLARMKAGVFEPPGNIPPDAEPLRIRFNTLLDDAASALAAPGQATIGIDPASVGRVSGAIAEMRRGIRAATLDRTARGEQTPVQAEEVLDAIKWLDSVAYHLWRAIHHLAHAAEAQDYLEEWST